MKLRLFLDVNVLVDVLTQRGEHHFHAAIIWHEIEQGRSIGIISASSVATIYYLIQKRRGHSQAIADITDLLEIFEVVETTVAVLRDALRIDNDDYEDAIQIISAQLGDADLIITRDASGFRQAEQQVCDPEQFIARFNQ